MVYSSFFLKSINISLIYFYQDVTGVIAPSSVHYRRWGQSHGSLQREKLSQFH
jgi:hypothetical protein